jgi:hypothetical protein
MLKSQVQYADSKPSNPNLLNLWFGLLKVALLLTSFGLNMNIDNEETFDPSINTLIGTSILVFPFSRYIYNIALSTCLARVSVASVG